MKNESKNSRRDSKATDDFHLKWSKKRKRSGQLSI